MFQWQVPLAAVSAGAGWWLVKNKRDTHRCRSGTANGGTSISLIMCLVTYDMTGKWVIGGTKFQLNLTAWRPLGRGDEHECVHSDREQRFRWASRMCFLFGWGEVCAQANAWRGFDTSAERWTCAAEVSQQHPQPTTHTLIHRGSCLPRFTFLSDSNRTTRLSLTHEHTTSTGDWQAGIERAG